jgi:hypothetical protein
MNDLTIVPRARPPQPTFITLEAEDVRPRPARRALMGPILPVARTALMVWGGISLFGVAAAAVVYGQVGFDLDRLVGSGPKRPAVQLASAVAATPARIPVAAPARPPKPAAAPAIATAAPVRQAVPVASAAAPLPAKPAAPSEMTVASLVPPPVDVDEPLIEARLPRPRPDEPVTATADEPAGTTADEPRVTGSLAQQHPYNARDPVRWSRRRPPMYIYYYPNFYRAPPY